MVAGRSMEIKSLKQMVFVGWALLWIGVAVAEPVDPRFPSERKVEQEMVITKWSWWPPARIQQLSKERDQLLEKISRLPQHDPQFQTEYLGYHSSVEEPGHDGGRELQQLNFQFLWSIKLGSIALAPAFRPLDLEKGIYAFPKRFKIEVRNEETEDFEVVVDWTEQDYPNPGPYPAFFSDIDRLVKHVRISVPLQVQDTGVAYFTLGEVYLFRQEDGDNLGSNAVVWDNVVVQAMDSFSLQPLWDLDYVSDGLWGVGFSLSDEKVAAKDLIVALDKEPKQNEKIQFILDLGRVVRIGRIDLWPAEAPYLLALPSFGFPEQVSVELSQDPDFKFARTIEVTEDREHLLQGNLYTVFCQEFRARFIRITLEGLSEYMGERILGLGEIVVTQNDINLSLNSKISASGIPEKYLKDLPRLVDGCSRQRRILSQGEWIKGLAIRRPLDARLMVVENELAKVGEAWRRIIFHASVWSGGLVSVLLVGGLLQQRRQRRRSFDSLKRRIARDLHDEVGSNLGSILLTAERLESDVADPQLKDDLADLSLLSREASASLRDVIWVVDQTRVRLSQLVESLIKRAQMILNNVELTIQTSPKTPDLIVPLSFKRHLIMFFKEAVHNCARHADATKVTVAVLTEMDQLKLIVSDNGCGFDLNKKHEGWGMDSMHKRAVELGGEMEIVSQSGGGTTISLVVPFSAFDHKVDHFYNTSN